MKEHLPSVLVQMMEAKRWLLKKRVKRLMGSLRALFRSSPDTGRHPRVTELKSCLRASPRKARVEPDDGHEECDEREGGARVEESWL